LKKSSLLVAPLNPPEGDLLIIRDFHNPLGGQGVKERDFFNSNELFCTNIYRKAFQFIMIKTFLLVGTGGFVGSI
jgi:hypothetical protein